MFKNCLSSLLYLTQGNYYRKALRVYIVLTSSISILRIQDFFAGIRGAAVNIRKGGKGTSLAVGEGSSVRRHSGQVGRQRGVYNSGRILNSTVGRPAQLD